MGLRDSQYSMVKMTKSVLLIFGMHGRGQEVSKINGFHSLHTLEILLEWHD